MRSLIMGFLMTGMMLLVGCASDDSATGFTDADFGSTGNFTSPGAFSSGGSGTTSGLPSSGPTSGSFAAAGSSPFANAGGASSGSAPLQPDVTNEGDNYENPGVNPFVMTSHDPFSTFAADVDTASYDLFVRDANLGIVPQPDSVRLEEYVNYFAYDYAAPEVDSEVPFRISLGAAPHLLDRGTTVLRVGIQGKLPPPFVKKPANLVFLVDVSGSMQSADKLPLVKRVLTHTLTILDPEDTVSIVTYASGTAVRLQPTPVSQASTIAEAINSLSAGGSTNGAGGIQLAYDQAESAFRQGGINHVILCTDGDFNVGVSSTSALVDLIEEKRKSGVTLTALGFGIGNLNDAMMEAVSNAGNGIYGVISSIAQADRYVEERMLSTLVHIAKDMKIQVEFNPEHVLAYRLLGYENRAIADEDFRNDLVDAGEIGAGHRVTALYELVRVGDAVPEPTGAPEMDSGEPVAGEREIAAEDLVLVKVRYKQPDASEADPASEVAQVLTPDQVGADYTDLDPDFRWAVAISALAEVLRKSPYAQPGDLNTIHSTTSALAGADVDRVEFVNLLTRIQPLLAGR